MLITKQIEIDMGHRVPNHKSKCRNLHGHRYKIEVGVDDKLITELGSSDEGMVIDFSDLKEIMVEIIDSEYDHTFTIYYNDILAPIFKIIEIGGSLLFSLKNAAQALMGGIKSRPVEDISPYNGVRINYTIDIPTAENLAKLWYQAIKEPLLSRGIKIHHVKVWETPTSTATYTEA